MGSSLLLDDGKERKDSSSSILIDGRPASAGALESIPSVYDSPTPLRTNSNDDTTNAVNGNGDIAEDGDDRSNNSNGSTKRVRTRTGRSAPSSPRVGHTSIAGSGGTSHTALPTTTTTTTTAGHSRKRSAGSDLNGGICEASSAASSRSQPETIVDRNQRLLIHTHDMMRRLVVLLHPSQRPRSVQPLNNNNSNEDTSSSDTDHMMARLRIDALQPSSTTPSEYQVILIIQCFHVAFSSHHYVVVIGGRSVCIVYVIARSVSFNGKESINS
jgi:hypothetical protein